MLHVKELPDKFNGLNQGMKQIILSITYFDKIKHQLKKKLGA